MMQKDSGKADDGFVVLNIAETLQNCLCNGLMVVNQDECVTALNQEAEHILQIPAAKVVDQSISGLPEPFRILIEETFRTGKKFASRQILLPADGPEERRVEVSGLVLGDENGPTREIVLNISDVGAARKLEDNLRRLDRLASLGTLSASMAHEVKNAMVPIKTFLELLQDEEKSEGRSAELSELAHREMERINSIISQMLRLAGPAKPTFAPIHVHKIIEQSLNLIRHSLEGHRINLETVFLAANDKVGADAYQMEQAFLNLFFNAIDAMGDGGSITVTTSEAKVISHSEPEASKMLKIIVTDNGIGIPPENMDRLFETFFTTKSEGTGLGLAITRRIFQEHGGRMDIESQLNKGTTVNILLPLSR